MDSNTSARDFAERHFRALQSQTAENSTFDFAAAQAKATADKTERLKALRLERDGALRPEARKVIRSQTGKHIGRR